MVIPTADLLRSPLCSFDLQCFPREKKPGMLQRFARTRDGSLVTAYARAGDLFSPRDVTYDAPVFRHKMMFGPFYFLEHCLACP